MVNKSFGLKDFQIAYVNDNNKLSNPNGRTGYYIKDPKAPYQYYFTPIIDGSNLNDYGWDPKYPSFIINKNLFNIFILNYYKTL